MTDLVTSEALTWAVEPGATALHHTPAFADIGAALDWLRAVDPAVRAGLHEHGAVVLRGLPVRTIGDFAAVRDVLMPDPTPYREKATPRSDFGDGVFSSTDLPPSQPIRMHNENSYTLTFPGLLMFGCLTAPEEGGATAIADCREVLDRVPAAIADRVREHGWALRRRYSEHIATDWPTAFATTERAEVERYCAENLISCEWDAEGDLRTSQVRPGIIHHPVTGAPVWFNHLAFWNEWSLDEEMRETLVEEFGPDGLPFATGYGDGAPASRADVEALNEAYAGATRRRPWVPGDVMLVDNVLATHGRDAFRGDRRIVVAMGAPVRVVDCSPTVPPSAGGAR